MNQPRRLLLLASLLALGACTTDAVRTSPPAVSPFQAALDAPGRFPADRAKDEARKPWAVFEFLGVKPGMQVLDFLTGGGYTTEYLAAVVGPEGRVTAFNTPAYDNFVKDELAARYTPGRLPNVTRQSSEIAALQLAPESLDAIIVVQSLHDLWWVNEPTWPRVDQAAVLAKLRAALKPGGLFGVVDHEAVAGSGASDTQKLHRIEKAFIIAQLRAAGFILEDESPVLKSTVDDRAKSVFDPAVRGKTDQFVLRFRKPR
jgi:predicted methyltransferase